jgi:iron complex transport system substrate-binding protein
MRRKAGGMGAFADRVRRLALTPFERRGPGGSLALCVLVLAVSVTGAAVARLAPASLLPPPERPYATGPPRVRSGSATYPRRATGADDVEVDVAGEPARLASQHWSADEFLYAVVPPERVVGASDAAWQPGLSNLLELVERHRPARAMDPELLLRARPDLVFTPDSARSDQPALLRAAGLSVYRMHTAFETIASIVEHVRLVGYLTGQDTRAAAEAARIEGVVGRAAARRSPDGTSPRVLGMGGVYSYGRRTLFHDVLRVVGAENLAATHGLVGYDRVTGEHVVRWNPDWIIAGADRGAEAEVRARLLAMPAVAATSAARTGRVVVLPHHLFLPLSPFVTGLVEALADALYGEAGP